ncbi:PaaI family thioesterase [Micropruina sp.]|uniref:PaaI family thioesterase n=1 Tax=Micropruina sp. TaxID=2737536 RepID=UPI0039E6BA0B
MSLPEWAAFAPSALDHKMGLELIEVSATRTVGRMPVQGNTQPFGYWHGGASCVLAETLASLSAFAEVGPSGVVFGIDINATHHRSIRDGWVNGVATALFVGGRLGTWEVVLSNDAGERLCTARVTCALQRPSRRDT